MDPVQIIGLLRIAVSAAASIGLDIARVRDMMAENENGELSQDQIDLLLAESQEAINQL